jgi:hypothetical protein
MMVWYGVAVPRTETTFFYGVGGAKSLVIARFFGFFPCVHAHTRTHVTHTHIRPRMHPRTRPHAHAHTPVHTSHAHAHKIQYSKEQAH